MKKSKLSTLKKVIRESIKQLMAESAICNPAGTPGGEGNNCGINGDCSGVLQSSQLGGGFCLCKVAGGGVIGAGSDEGCAQDNITNPNGPQHLDHEKQRAGTPLSNSWLCIDTDAPRSGCHRDCSGPPCGDKGIKINRRDFR